MSKIMGRLTRKIHTSRNHRFHVYELKTKRRAIQAVYFGFNPPVVNTDLELLMTGKWYQSVDFGTQFHISVYEPASPVIERTKHRIDQLLKMVEC